MNLADLPIIKIKRVMSEEESSELVGTMVENLEANCNEAGIYVDEEQTRLSSLTSRWKKKSISYAGLY